jgi:hypothetical protein
MFEPTVAAGRPTEYANKAYEVADTISRADRNKLGGSIGERLGFKMCGRCSGFAGVVTQWGHGRAWCFGFNHQGILLNPKDPPSTCTRFDPIQVLSLNMMFGMAKLIDVKETKPCGFERESEQ